MRELMRRIAMLLGHRRWRRELAEEMRLHRELRAGGDRAFGNDLRLLERSQAQWGWTWLETWLQDTRHGLRLLRRTPLITALALVSLALGIGATTALFSLADAVLLRPLPVPHPEQLMQVYTLSPTFRRPSPSFTEPMWQQVRQHQDVFSSVFAWGSTQFTLREGGQQLRLWGVQASGEYFSTLGVRPELGRLFGAQDDYRGCPAIADISDAFWRTHYGASPKALGSALQLGDQSYTVIGVMPPYFFGTDVGTRINIAAPLCTQRTFLGVRDAWWLGVMGRLKPGVTPAAANARLATMAPAWMAATVPDWPKASERQNYRARRWSIAPGGRGASWVGQRYGTALWILLGIAGLVLLVACANLAGLMLARAAARRQEISVRSALGAGRGRLIRQLLTESALLAAGGLVLGVAFAYWACQAAEAFLKAQINLSLDGSMLAFALAVTAVTALLVGLAPALRITGRARPSAGRGAAVAAVAAAVVLLAGAGLFLRSFTNLTHANLGFDPVHVAIIAMDYSVNTHVPAGAAANRQRTLAALRALPGVDSASSSFMVPLQGLQWDTPLQSRTGSVADAYLNAVSPGYFATLRIPLLEGRDFSSQDGPQAPAVAVVNESAARELFPHTSALGQPLWQGEGKQRRQFEVVGVVADTKYLSVSAPAPPVAFFALQQSPDIETVNFELRTKLPPATLTAQLHRVMAQHDPSADYSTSSLEGFMAAGLRQQRLLAWLSGLFGGLALLLTALGLYGIMAYRVERRRREFGIRMALGARPQEVRRLALRDAAGVLALGLALGVPAAWLGARSAQATLSGLLYRLQPTDALTLAGAALILAAAAFAAAWLPARRAAHADPMNSLRED